MKYSIDPATLEPFSLKYVAEWADEADPRIIVYETTFDVRQLRGRFQQDIIVPDRLSKRRFGKGHVFGKHQTDTWRLLIRFGPHGHGRAVLELSDAGGLIHRRTIEHPNEMIRMAFQDLMVGRALPKIAEMLSSLSRSRRLTRNRMKRKGKVQDQGLSLRSKILSFGRWRSPGIRSVGKEKDAEENIDEGTKTVDALS